MATMDITDYWDTFLNELYELMTVLKIPGRKVKSKFLNCFVKVSSAGKIFK